MDDPRPLTKSYPVSIIILCVALICMVVAVIHIGLSVDTTVQAETNYIIEDRFDSGVSDYGSCMNDSKLTGLDGYSKGISLWKYNYCSIKYAPDGWPTAVDLDAYDECMSQVLNKFTTTGLHGYNKAELNWSIEYCARTT